MKIKIPDLIAEKELIITGRMENKKGANTHYRLNDGSIITRELAVDMHEKGFFNDYGTFIRNGVKYLRDIRDDDKKDNIDEQPLFTFTVTELPRKK